MPGRVPYEIVCLWTQYGLSRPLTSSHVSRNAFTKLNGPLVGLVQGFEIHTGSIAYNNRESEECPYAYDHAYHRKVISYGLSTVHSPLWLSKSYGLGTTCTSHTRSALFPLRSRSSDRSRNRVNDRWRKVPSNHLGVTRIGTHRPNRVSYGPARLIVPVFPSPTEFCGIHTGPYSIRSTGFSRPILNPQGSIRFLHFNFNHVAKDHADTRRTHICI